MSLKHIWPHAMTSRVIVPPPLTVHAEAGFNATFQLSFFVSSCEVTYQMPQLVWGVCSLHNWGCWDSKSAHKKTPRTHPTNYSTLLVSRQFSSSATQAVFLSKLPLASWLASPARLIGSVHASMLTILNRRLGYKARFRICVSVRTPQNGIESRVRPVSTFHLWSAATAHRINYI